MELIRKLENKIQNYIAINQIRRLNRGIHKTTVFKNPELISIGHNCRIGENSHILCWKNYIFGELNQKLDSTLIFGNNFSATRNLMIQCCNRITIGDNVLIASNVFICDYNHGIDSLKGSYLTNKLVIDEVVISDGVWIGQGAYILPGVHIGKKSIIGAGSVVTKDVPEYCIAVGNPAKIVKKYNFKSNSWEFV